LLGRGTHPIGRLGTLAVVLLFIAGGIPARGAQVTLISDMPGGEDWNNGARWSDGAPANSANDYFVGSGAGKLLRSPLDAAAATFPGNSLQLDATGIFRLKPLNNATVTLNDLRMNGGILHNGNGGNTTTVMGAIHVLTPSNLDLSVMTNNTFNNGADNPPARTLLLGASIDGAAQLNIGNGVTAALPTSTNFATYSRIETQNANNTFSGGWNVISGILRGVAPGSLGTGNITVGTAGGFDTDYDVFLEGRSLTLNGLMQLDQNDRFASVSINGTPLAAGTYSAGQLAAQFPNNFVPGGTGSLTVVPEPGSLAVLVVPAALLLPRRGRRR
jgi:hypothetical protein